MSLIGMLVILVAVVAAAWIVIEPLFEKKDVRYEECQECKKALVIYKYWFKNGGVCFACKEKLDKQKANTKQDGTSLK